MTRTVLEFQRFATKSSTLSSRWTAGQEREIEGGGDVEKCTEVNIDSMNVAELSIISRPGTTSVHQQSSNVTFSYNL